MTAESKSRVLHENLDTSFVNLWSLLRSLSQRGFIGRVHVELTDYTADVYMTGSNAPLVHEIDRAAGTETLEQAALHRLVLRARESSGSISVFEGADEAVVVRSAAVSEDIIEPAARLRLGRPPPDPSSEAPPQIVGQPAKTEPARLIQGTSLNQRLPPLHLWPSPQPSRTMPKGRLTGAKW